MFSFLISSIVLRIETNHQLLKCKHSVKAEQVCLKGEKMEENLFQNENKSQELPKEMAPGSLWICNVEVNVVHVLVRDRARIKLEGMIF